MRSCQNCGSKTEGLFKVDVKDFPYNTVRKSVGNIPVCKKCKDYFEKRADKLKKIIKSDIAKRLIIAGPGTGKTHAFQEVVKNMPNQKKILIFTLINNLAYDLTKDFADLKFNNVKVRTFHGYCKNLLYNELGSSDEYYPAIALLIENDAQLLDLMFTESDFHKAFANLDEDSPALQFFLQRSSYYEAIGHDDSVYKVYHYYLNNNEAIPRYDLVIADEYQDFNKLETLFIKILTKTVHVLIAGDDDQALYGFREASNKYIRDLYHDTDFDKFNLPFSSRCTDVLVDSVNHLIKEAKTIGLLGGRIEEKEYVSYWPNKYMFDLKYPMIQAVDCSKPETAMLYIKTQIEKITNDEGLTGNEKDIQFLIIGAESQHRLNSLAKYLEDNLDDNLYEIEVKEDKEKVAIEKGFLLIHKNPESNLGWRIIMYKDPPQAIKKIIELSYKNGSSIFDLLPKEYKDKYLSISEEYFSQNDHELKSEDSEKSETKKIRIKLTNCLGSKGLSALHVMVMEFHNGVIPNDKTGNIITDDDVYRCIVTLTRAKRSCSLITFKEFSVPIGKLIERPSIFLKILPPQNLRKIDCKICKGKLVCSD